MNHESERGEICYEREQKRVCNTWLVTQSASHVYTVTYVLSSLGAHPDGLTVGREGGSTDDG